MATKQLPPCCVQGCNRPVEARGLCKSHYHGACRLVKKGAESWHSLVDMGLAKPPGISRQPSMEWLAAHERWRKENASN